MKNAIGWLWLNEKQNETNYLFPEANARTHKEKEKEKSKSKKQPLVLLDRLASNVYQIASIVVAVRLT